MEEVFITHFLLQMLRRNHVGFFSDSPAMPPEFGRKIGLARSFTRIEDMIRWSAGLVPRQARVWVFPYGGSTYAIAKN